jgi:hypothetical protein
MTRYKTTMHPVVLDNGYIEYTSKNVPLTDEELAEVEALEAGVHEEIQRLHREFLLVDTDFLAGLSDRPLSDEMRDYRQALRDITTHANWPNLNDEDWPTKPE